MGANKRYRSSSFTDSGGSGSEGERPHKAGPWCCRTQCVWFLTCPPTGRYEEHDRWNRDEDDAPRGFGLPAVPVNTDMTGDEAYQRRLALSSSLQQPAPSVVADDRDVSGDDAYARRLAMSSNQLSKDGAGDDAYQRRVTMSPTPQVHQPVPPSEPPSLAYNPFAPVSVPPPPTGPPPSIEDEVARKKEAAAAIAAKFNALAAIQPPEESNPAPQNTVHRYCPLLLQYGGIQ
jgi:splicing factor 45